LSEYSPASWAHNEKEGVALAFLAFATAFAFFLAVLAFTLFLLLPFLASGRIAGGEREQQGGSGRERDAAHGA
jgi:hypothetical protein